MTPLEIALGYIKRGLAPIPIPYREKKPENPKWQKLRLNATNAADYFNGARQNIGVLLGEPSGNLIDADLDCREALALAGSFLPQSESEFGRPSKPRSHRCDISALPKRIEFTDPDDGEMLLELRTNGGQTVFPGSTHESGEAIEWYEDGDPAEVDPAQITTAAGRLAAACVLVRTAPASDRHDYLLDISGALVRGLDRDGAAALLSPVARLILGKLYNKAEGNRLLDDTAHKVAAGEPASGWPKLAERIGEKRARKISDWLGLQLRNAPPGDDVDEEDDPRECVVLSPKSINKAARRCADLLRDTVYLRGSVPSTLVRAEAHDHSDRVEIGGVLHARNSLILTTPSVGLLQYVLDERVAFFKQSKPTACPKDLAARLIDAATELKFRQCSGIVSVPLFLGGEIVATPGYHARTGKIIAFDGPLPPLPEAPTKADALAALDVLLQPFRGYDPQLRSGLAAAALTAIARASLSTAPALVLDANTPGAGKGKLARALAVLASGTLPAIITEGHGQEETEKRIASAILSGCQVLLLDNLQRTLASSTLESILTEGVATIRQFGKLGADITVPFSGLVIVTSNNAALRADMLRRMLPIRIVVDTDEPEKREFGFDPYLEAKRDRLQLLAAAFTILRAWRNSGQKATLTLGSFEQWAGLVAGAVEWLTGTNPISLIEERKAEDPLRGEERQVIVALRQLFAEAEWTAKEAVGWPSALSRLGEEPQPATGIDPEIWRNVLQFKGERPNPVEVGKWLGRQKDKVFGDLRLTCKLDRNKTAQWTVTEGQVRVSRVSAGVNLPQSAREVDSETEEDVLEQGEFTPAHTRAHPQHPSVAAGKTVF